MRNRKFAWRLTRLQTTSRNSRLGVTLFPARVTVADAQKGQEMVKLSTERKHLTNVLKMVAYQTESDLVELIRPHYSRVEDEGRTFIQIALQGYRRHRARGGTTSDNVAQLSSPHRRVSSKPFARHSTRRTRCSRAPGFKCVMRSHPRVLKQKRTGCRQPMSGVLKLLILHSDKNRQNRDKRRTEVDVGYMAACRLMRSKARCQKVVSHRIRSRKGG